MRKKFLLIAVMTAAVFTLQAKTANDTYRVFALSNASSMGSVIGSGVYPAGDVVLTATANENYHFVCWSNGSTDAQLTINLQSDTAIAATFAIDRHYVSAEPNDRKLGYVEGDFGDWDHGTEVYLQATPMNEHVTFVSWNDGSKENPRMPVVDKDIILTANFLLNQYEVTANASEGGTVSGGGTYDYGTIVTLKATPEKGYSFVGWSDGKTCDEISISVVDSITITANFEAVIPSSIEKVVDNQLSNAQNEKYIQGGNLYIRSGEAVYDTKGAKVK